MASQGTSKGHEPDSLSRVHRFVKTGLFLRVLVALVISVLIVMAFFATTALSH